MLSELSLSQIFGKPSQAPLFCPIGCQPSVPSLSGEWFVLLLPSAACSDLLLFREHQRRGSCQPGAISPRFASHRKPALTEG